MRKARRVAHNAQRLITWFQPAALVAFLAICLGASACTAGNVRANSTQATKPAMLASFDCSQAANATEKLICSDAQTTALDGKLQQAYKTALSATDASGKKALAKEQRNWIRFNRDMCQDTPCLRQVYSGRIAALEHNAKYIGNDESYCIKPSGYPAGANDCGVSVEVYRDPNDRIDSFNQILSDQNQSGRIIVCRRLIDLWDGTHIGPGRGEESFGGYCVLQKGTQRQDVAICNDEMVGDFQMQPVIPQDMSDKHLIDFMYKCSGS